MVGRLRISEPGKRQTVHTPNRFVPMTPPRRFSLPGSATDSPNELDGLFIHGVMRRPGSANRASANTEHPPFFPPTLSREDKVFFLKPTSGS